MPPEVVAVRKAFEDSAPDFRHAVNETLNLVKMGASRPGAYAEALPQLQTLASNPSITAAQKEALTALIEAIKMGTL